MKRIKIWIEKTTSNIGLKKNVSWLNIIHLSDKPLYKLAVGVPY